MIRVKKNGKINYNETMFFEEFVKLGFEKKGIEKDVLNDLVINHNDKKLFAFGVKHFGKKIFCH